MTMPVMGDIDPQSLTRIRQNGVATLVSLARQIRRIEKQAHAGIVECAVDLVVVTVLFGLIQAIHWVVA